MNHVYKKVKSCIKYFVKSTLKIWPKLCLKLLILKCFLNSEVVMYETVKFNNCKINS